MKTLKNKNIIVVGLGRSGIGAANLLIYLGANVWVTDIKPINSLKDDIKRLSPQVKIVTGGHPEEVFNKADMIVISPGVPLDIPPIMHARERGVPVIGELELAYQIVTSNELRVMSKNSKLKTQNSKLNSSLITHHSSLPFIAVTGTNGKSTTTTLIDLMLKKAGFRTIMGGNIGNALTEEIYKIVTSNKLQVTSKDKDSLLVTRYSLLDYIVAEISSFQLESIIDFRPKVASILNITPDHLDRYHNIEEYIDAKARIFENQTESDYLILNADDPVTKVISEKLKVKSEIPKLLYFSRQREVNGVYLKDGVIYGKSPYFPLSTSHFPLISVDEIKIKGVHNLENAMAASLAAIISGCSADAVRNVLKEFPGLEHRLEFVCEVDGVSFINDSKGTNIGAVIKSLESFQKVILVMGGRDKAGDFTVLRDLVRGRVKTLILLGEAKEKIEKALGDVVDTVLVDSLREAIEAAMSKAQRGDVVLLSPGCASFDMFLDFEDRGRKFKAAVRKMQDARCKMQDARYKIQDARCKMQDA
ncbi:MAG: UDP-N-acetylmuramoyl-L-alanine--D-glutamate ligase [Nitrospirae bacterium]|nr:UDP-N-acetylmuramoyl-L-alanine--D-glutamate ligase [Nitrospirota bacterium]